MAVSGEEVGVDLVDETEEILDPGFELVDEGEVEAEETEPQMSAEELAKHLEELKTQNEALKAQADSAGQLKGAFENFASKLAVPPSEQVKEPEGPPQVQIDWAQLEAQVNQDAFKNPFQSTMKSVAPVLQQMQTQFDYKLAQVEKKNKLVESKLALTADKGLGEVYGKYRDEVEQTVKTTGTDYVTAARQVRMAHEDEIIAEKVAAAVETMKAELAKNEPANAVPPGFTNSGSLKSGAAKAGAVKRVAVSPEIKAAIRQTALNWAMNPDDPEDLKYVYDQFKAAGKI